MDIKLIGISSSLPAWSKTAIEAYQKRISAPNQLSYQVVKPSHQGHGATIERKTQDGLKLLQLSEKGLRIGLDSQGKILSSEELAQKLEQWQLQQQKISFLIGGAYGHCPNTLAECNETISLGKLTLNHPFVFALMSEQIYRAICIINRHPYHK